MFLYCRGVQEWIILMSDQYSIWTSGRIIWSRYLVVVTLCTHTRTHLKARLLTLSLLHVWHIFLHMWMQLHTLKIELSFLNWIVRLHVKSIFHMNAWMFAYTKIAEYSCLTYVYLYWCWQSIFRQCVSHIIVEKAMHVFVINVWHYVCDLRSVAVSNTCEPPFESLKKAKSKCKRKKKQRIRNMKKTN